MLISSQPQYILELHLIATFGSNVSTSITVQRALGTFSAVCVTINPGTSTKEHEKSGL